MSESKPIRYEYKVIEPRATGVPQGKGDSFQQRLESGLNTLGREGWMFAGTIGGCISLTRVKKGDN